MNRLCRPLAGAIRRGLFGLALALLVQAAWAQAPLNMEPTLKQMLSAMQAGSVSEFAAPGDDAFKASMNQAMLDQVRAQLAPRLAQGYTATLLGTLRQHGLIVYLWKLEFKDGKDDRLVTMAVNAGKVVGFFLQ